MNGKYPNLRYKDGVVHSSRDEEPTDDIRATLCEAPKNGFDLTNAMFDDSQLKLTRAPITCMTCIALERKFNAAATQ